MLVASDHQIAVAVVVVADLVDMIVKDAVALVAMEEGLTFDGVLNDLQARCVPKINKCIKMFFDFEDFSKKYSKSLGFLMFQLKIKYLQRFQTY